MDLWSDQGLKDTQTMANTQVLDSFVAHPELLHVQRAYRFHVRLSERVRSFQEATMIPQKYFYCVYFLAGEVSLPPSPPPADDMWDKGYINEKKYPDLTSIRFPSLDDKVAQPLMACEVPLPPSPPPSLGDEVPYMMPLSIVADIPLPPSPPPADDVLEMGYTDKKKYQDLTTIPFPSLDDEVACLMSQRLSINPWEVPLPPSPPPSLGDEEPYLMPLSVMGDIPLPPSPPPVDHVLEMGYTDKKKYQDLTIMPFPSLDDNADAKCPNMLLQEVPLPLSPLTSQEKKYPDLSNIRFPSLDDNADPKCPNMLPQELPLPPSPPPSLSDEEPYLMPLSVMGDIPLPPSPPPALWDEVPHLMPVSVLADIPLPPSSPPADDVTDIGYIDEKYPDLKNIGFPSLDDNADAKCPNMLLQEVPLHPSPLTSQEKKYPDLCNIRFPSLDDDADPKCPNMLPQEIPLLPSPSPTTQEKKNPDLSNIRFPSLDDDADPKYPTKASTASKSTTC
ncbi:nuclear pore complex-interacting protein family member B13-like [Centropristis striata]|uniref:nuclear pore complex-interacting protein family member B13-like n=1 Tax=Centropristis striata TaxID=184440 RepID=UPI0027DF1328|nr:nuclear pore complex-interacting protein family member B13-like [Centropristis striata]